MQTSSKVFAVVQGSDVDSVYKGSGEGSTTGERGWRRLTALDDGLHVWCEG